MNLKEVLASVQEGFEGPFSNVVRFFGETVNINYIFIVLALLVYSFGLKCKWITTKKLHKTAR